MTDARIVVLGAGPAGAATACGLARIGYAVTVIGHPRRFPAVEGVSRRVLDGLRHAGLTRAAACATGPYARTTRWNGATQALNTEWLIERTHFDLALHEDLTAAGIEILSATIRTVESGTSGHHIVIDAEGERRILHADFLIEARGRQAPRPRPHMIGPRTLGLTQVWQGAPGTSGAAVESLEQGWGWMARLPNGLCYWQISLDLASAELPPRRQLLDYCHRLSRQSRLAQTFFGTDAPLWQNARMFARDSTAMLPPETCGANWLRVGDAAMTADPLSGNGIFQSLSSALQAPAVAHTLLTCPERAALAQHFHQSRIEHLFLRFARTGRDFYALEKQWPQAPFWHARRAWPDQQPAHASATGFAALNIEQAPVIDGNLIAPARVVTSPDQPLGIWRLDGIELAPIIAALQRQPAAQVLSALSPRSATQVRAWLTEQGCADVLAAR